MLTTLFKNIIKLFKSEPESLIEAPKFYISEQTEKFLEQNFNNFNPMDLLYYKNLSEEFLLNHLHQFDLLSILKTQVLSESFLNKIKNDLPKTIKLKEYIIAGKIVRDDVYLIIPISHSNIIQTGSRCGQRFSVKVVADFLVDSEVCRVFSNNEIYKFIVDSEFNLQKMEIYANKIDSKNKSIIESSKVKAKI